MPVSSTYNSARFASLDDSLAHSKNNPFVISNTSIHTQINDKIIKKGYVFKRFEFLLQEYTETSRVKITEYQHPEFFSQRVYGTPDLWYIVLWINGMRSFLDFNIENVKILTSQGLTILNRILEKYRNNINETKQNPIVFNDATIIPVDID